jgi:hypothetical protein
MQTHTDFTIGSLVRIEYGDTRLNIIVEKVGVRKVLGRVDLGPNAWDDHGFSAFRSSDIIEVLDHRYSVYFLEAAIERMTTDSEMTPCCPLKLTKKD